MPSAVGLRISALAGATGLLCAACNGWGGRSVAPPPRIVFEETEYEFGHVSAGTTVAHTFTFRNAGGHDLSIDSMRTSCECTAVTSTRIVPAGGEGTIRASFDTRDDFGQRTRTITVYSNDPAQAVTTLALRGVIDADVAANPPQLYVGHLRRGQAAPSDVRLIINDAVAITVGPVETSGAVVASVLPDSTAQATGKRLRVTVKPDAPLGPFNDSVLVHTNSSRRPVLTIPVAGVVDADTPSGSAEDKSSRE